jgi:hypothetical protein
LAADDARSPTNRNTSMSAPVDRNYRAALMWTFGDRQANPADCSQWSSVHFEVPPAAA